MGYIENGRETMDQTPVAYPLHFSRPEPLHLRIRRLILEQMQESMSYTEVDTAEEADDFSTPDDDEMPGTPYEMEDDFDNINSAFWKGGAGGETSPDMGTDNTGGVPPHTDTIQKSDTK